ncbi:MAG: ShlB/FhaC/HecB family hemolysin secretion/activation protein [Nitrospirae bacterium]|nr:ShlB/FhaC/HecB family hemolysin secretion/activation protein [Nitrospirota bacterium]
MIARILIHIILLSVLFFIPSGIARADELPPAVSGNSERVSESSGGADSQKKTLSGLEKVFVRKFRFQGNTVVSDLELSRLTSSYEAREITFEQLQSLRQELTLYYINKGYVTSGVVIPDQELVDGTVTLQIIEGIARDITVEGMTNFRPSYFVSRLSAAAGPPVNVYAMQEALLRLQQDPRIKKVNAELSPGILQGESVMKVRIEENPPYVMQFKVSNSQSPSIGPLRGEMLVAHQNLFGFGDIMTGSFALTEGISDYSFSYAIPVTSHDTMLEFHYRKSNSTVIEEPFKGLDIQSKSDTYGITLSHPVFRKAGQELIFGLTAELRENRTFLLGRPFSFSGDTEGGKSSVTVLRFSQEWASRGQAQVIAARSSFSAGIDAFGADVNSKPADGQFLTWLGQIQWIRQLNERGLQIRFRTDIQLASDALLPLEKFSVGGMNSVRGFRENQLVRDNGLSSSLELRIPLFYNKFGDSVFNLVPFTDFGWSWNNKIQTPFPKTILSLGLGFVWAITDRFSLQVYGGVPWRKIDTNGNDLQDKGIHFLLTGRLF